MSVDTPQGIIEAYPKSIYRVKALNMIDLLKELEDLEITKSAYSFGEYHHLVTNPHVDAIFEVQKRLKEVKGLEILKTEPSVEDCFMYLMNN